MRLFLIVLSAIVLAISIASTLQGSEGWVQVSCWAIFVLSLVGIAEALTSYVTLGDENIRMRKNFRSTVISRDSVESVAAAKGCPTLLVLKDGGKVEIPDLGGQGIENSLRAWLKAG